jgi:hypothetical protein
MTDSLKNRCFLAHFASCRRILIRCCIVLFIVFAFPQKIPAQLNPKAKEAFNKGNFEKAISLYQQDFQKTSEGNSHYHPLLYNLAEAYRLSGNYRMADSLHAMVDYSKTSYWGYALTLLQQYRADKCLKFVKYHLKFDSQHPELTRIETACELIRNKIDESKVILKTFPVPQKKSTSDYTRFLYRNAG